MSLTDLEKQLMRRVDLLTRGVPFHVHKDPDDMHEWECSSPYCATLLRSESRGPATGHSDA
jgi:hypothetical protein